MMLFVQTITDTVCGGDSICICALERHERMRAIRGKNLQNSWMSAEVERGRTGVSVKMLIRICDVLGLSADYVLFGAKRGDDDLRADRICHIDSRYLPLLDGVITELLALNEH